MPIHHTNWMVQVMGQQHEEEAFFTMVALVEDRLPQTCVLQVHLLLPSLLLGLAGTRG